MRDGKSTFASVAIKAMEKKNILNQLENNHTNDIQPSTEEQVSIIYIFVKLKI